MAPGGQRAWGWGISFLCIRLEPAGAGHVSSPGHSGSDKTWAGEALFKWCLLRAGLVKRGRKFWWISKWFLFPPPLAGSCRGFSSGLPSLGEPVGLLEAEGTKPGPSEVVISELCPLSPAVRQLQFKLPHRYWFPRRFRLVTSAPVSRDSLCLSVSLGAVVCDLSSLMELRRNVEFPVCSAFSCC